MKMMCGMTLRDEISNAWFRVKTIKRRINNNPLEVVTQRWLECTSEVMHE